MTTPITYLLPFLPLDVIIEILLRLSVKSLLRLSLVSKKWQTIITSSYFQYLHFKQQSNSTQPLVCLSRHSDVVYYSSDFFSSITLFLNDATQSNPLRVDKGPESVYDICGPCNGIICLRLHPIKFALWNPATRKLWPIPHTHVPVYDHEVNMFSFWVDSLTNTFKFFMITIVMSREHGEMYGTMQSCFVMYSSIDGSWTETQLPFALNEFCPPFNNYSITNGFLYFLKKNEEADSHVIIVYDIAMDLFQEVEMPGPKQFLMNIMLDLYGESLALLALAYDPYLKRDGEMVPIQIWVMKETGCWTKLFNVNIPAHGTFCTFWNENELFITRYTDNACKTQELIIYNLLSGKPRKLEVAKADEFNYCRIRAICYKESLFSVDA